MSLNYSNWLLSIAQTLYGSYWGREIPEWMWHRCVENRKYCQTQRLERQPDWWFYGLVEWSDDSWSFFQEGANILIIYCSHSEFNTQSFVPGCEERVKFSMWLIIVCVRLISTENMDLNTSKKLWGPCVRNWNKVLRLTQSAALLTSWKWHFQILPCYCEIRRLVP